MERRKLLYGSNAVDNHMQGYGDLWRWLEEYCQRSTAPALADLVPVPFHPTFCAAKERVFFGEEVLAENMWFVKCWSVKITDQLFITDHSA